MRNRTLLLVVLAAGLTLLASAPGQAWASDAGHETASAPAKKRVKLADQWAGKVQGTNAYISLFTLNNGQAGSYLADGADIATLVLGKRTGAQLELRPTGSTTVTANVAGSTVDGTVTLNGTSHSFTADRASGSAGWYRGRKKDHGDTIAAGFIVLADGSFRGAIRRGDRVVANPAFDPSHLVLRVPGDGKLKVLRVADFVKKEQRLA